MATRGRPIPATSVTQIQRLRQILSLRQTARETDVDKNTVTKYAGRNNKQAEPPPEQSPS